MADKLVAVRIKQQDNTYSNEIPIGAKAENVAYDNTKNLLQVLGTIDMYKGDVQTQLNALFEDFNGIAEDVAGAIDDWVTEHMPSWDPEEHLDDTLTADNLAPVSSAVPKLIAVNEAEIQGTKMKISTTGQEDLTILTPSDIDNTLSQQGEAADAKATGEMIIINNAATAGTKIRLVTTEEDIDFATKEDADNLAASLANEYDPTATYAVGNYCTYQYKLYRCTTAITTAEAWTAGHWTEVPLGTDLADQVGALKESLDFTKSYIIEEKDVVLPAVVKGNFSFNSNADGDEIISGTNNVAQLFNIKQGTYEINGLTFVVSGNTISVSGTATAAFNYSLVDGEAKRPSELMAMTLPLPEHLYTLSSKAVAGSTPYPSLCVRSKSSGNIVVSQNNTAQFTMDETTCGGLYLVFSNNTTYNFTYVVALFPFYATNSNVYREETSNIDVYTQTGIYALDGYTWTIGNPTTKELKTKLPKKPKCLYSTRTIGYSLMTECLDIYIPAKNGYINYIFGHTVNSFPASEGGGNVWRLVQVDSVNDALNFQFHITQLGETEMAIKINGRDDFIGGTTHGDEVMDDNSFIVLVDGKSVAVTSLTALTEFDKLQVFLVSNMYDPADHTTLVGVHGREWAFDISGLLLSQTVEFKENLTLGTSYMPMLCVLRGNDTVSALQVTDTYIDDGNFMPYDVSVGGFTNYPNQLKTDVRKMYLTGETSGVEATVEILEQPEGLNKEGTFLYNGVNTYNKIYCCMCGYGGGSNTQNVNNGDKWKVKSKITVEAG